MSAVIEVRNLTKTYTEGMLRRSKFQALAGISLDVKGGEIFGLLGPNGAGKTTFIKILLGIIAKSGGDAQMLDLPAGDRRSRRLVGYLPEHMRVPRHMTAWTALDFYGKLSGLPRSVVRERGERLLQTVGLTDRANDRVRKYSKGMLQRLGLAQALLHEPKLVILDEPTDGLDPVGRSHIRTILSDLKAQGTTVFLNSHILQEVELICDRVAILDRGRLLRVGPVSEIRHGQPQQAQEVEQGFDITLDVTAPQESVEQALNGVVQATNWEALPGGVLRVTAHAAQQTSVDQRVDRLRGANISILGLARRQASLEDAFLDIVGNTGE